jgi:hypothetical protein
MGQDKHTGLYSCNSNHADIGRVCLDGASRLNRNHMSQLKSRPF